MRDLAKTRFYFLRVIFTEAERGPAGAAPGARGLTALFCSLHTHLMNCSTPLPRCRDERGATLSVTRGVSIESACVCVCVCV